MKNISFYLLLLSFFLSFTFSSAQDEKPIATMYSIHHDPVKPSMFQEYERLAKEFVSLLKENDVQGFDYMASVSEEFNYYYISTIDKMADLDDNPLKGLSEEAQAKLKSIFDQMDECYEGHGNYMLYLDTTLTYMPEGFSASTPGQNYRTYFKHHYEPSDAENIYKAFKKTKELFAKNNAQMHYRIYHSGFGVVGNYILVAVSAENPIDFNNKNSKTWEVLGEEYMTVIGELMKYTSKYEVERAWMREDLGYKSQK